MFALVVQLLLRHSSPLGAILERVEVQRLRIRAAGRCRNDAGMVVRRRRNTRDERRHEQLREVEVADDVRPPLEIVTVLGELVNRGPHHASVRRLSVGFA